MTDRLSNLAELTSIRLDSNRLIDDSNLFVSNNQIDWDFRIYPKELTPYFQTLVDSIKELMQLEPKNYIFQVFDKDLYNQKKYLDIVHKDADRESCITIPILFNKLEPIMFYDDIPDCNPQEYRKLNKPWPVKPCQIGRYSEEHPTLVNLQTLHNVRILDKISPRVLFQLSFDLGFREIVDRNPDLWRFI